MKVQEYLKANNLQKLQDELKIKVREYPRLCVLNYDQCFSDKHNPIVQECRGLILEKDTWKVVARSFDRFFNYGESINDKDFPVDKSLVQMKLDGSIISVYNYEGKWNVATRSMAMGEGETPMDLTFRELFDKAVERTKVWEYLNEDIGFTKDVTYVFELTSPMNRIVTPYKDTTVTLIGARNNITGDELLSNGLDIVAEYMGVNRPKSFKCNSLNDVIENTKKLEVLEEGYVLVYERNKGSHWRIKVKSERYLAIAHLRNNGVISAKRLLLLIVMNEQSEYCNYFPEDIKYIDFVSGIWTAILNNIALIHEKNCNIEVQKDYALAIMKEVNNPWEGGILFDMRKKKITLQEVVKSLDANGVTRLAKIIKLKERMAKEFGIKMEEEDT
jgi:tRNA splicing ligase